MYRYKSRNGCDQLDRWVLRLQDRDESTYIRLIDKYSRLMWKTAWNILKDTADAADVEDCISEVFYKLWKSPEQFDPEKGSLKNYLCRMTSNVAIDLCRKRSREKSEVLNEDICTDDCVDWVLDEIMLGEEKENLYRAMETLNKRDRELISRRYFENQKPAQISTEMRMPLREVENRLYRIKGKLREQML